MVIRVGYVCGNIDWSGSLGQYFQSVIGKVRMKDRVEPVIIYQKGDENDAPQGVERIKMPERPMARWHRAVQRENLDLIHLNTSPLVGHISAALAPCPVVATIHGTAHWASDLPSDTIVPRRTGALWQLRDRLGKYTIDRFFAVSPHVKQVLTNFTGISKEQVSVAHEGISDQYFEAPRNHESKWAERRYLFHVSSPAAKKNVPRLVQAYAQYRDTVENPYSLVIAGGGWPDQLSDILSELGIEESVSCPGYVPQEMLINLYDHAELFIFPSLHETFGLPNIESMARGTPVLTTRQFAIPDIVGDAAAFIDSPTSASSIATALVSVAHDEQRLSDLSAKGINRSYRYTWNNHIEILEEEYDRLVSG